jgi:CTP synthase (UTP-ammonia lyase)
LIEFARDVLKEGLLRSVELEGHQFFLATLFQRSSTADAPGPLVQAFVEALRS